MYYTLDTSSPETITWTLDVFESSRTDVDCDLFINVDEYPSFDQWIARNISQESELTVTLEDAEPAKYIAGVYGYQGCSFHIRAEFSSPCPNDCNNRGTCSTQGVCECQDGFIGEECEVTMVTPGVQYSGFAPNLFSWSYFAFTADKIYDEIEWTVTPIDSNDHNCEMFTSTDKEPTLFNFDATQFIFSTDPMSLAQSEIEADHTYYMSVNGLFGVVACNFTASLRVVDPESPTECPNNCSYHASSYTCQNNECSCETNYVGVECEEYSQNVESGVTYSGWVGEDAWNFYHFEGQTNNPIIVTLNRLNDFGDLDLYVNEDTKPALFNFSYADVSTGTTMQVEVFEPLGKLWYIGIFGWGAANYTLTVEETSLCPCIDQAHGECLYNPEICYCNEGYGGADCSSPVYDLESGKVLDNQVVELDKWNYYQISGENASAASLTVKEDGEIGVAWVFVGFDGFPTTTDYVYSDKNHHNSTHQIAYHGKAEQSGMLFIGVYGSPFIPEVDGMQSVSYSIVCWVSDF